MKTTKTLHSIIVLLLILNLNAFGMNLVQTTADKIKQADTILNQNFDQRIFKAHLKGELILHSAPFGYGCKNCIDTLNKHNINVQQNWPLAPVLLYLPIPKTNPEDTQLYFDVTKSLPSAFIEHAIQNNLQQEITRRKHTIVTLLEGESDQLKNEKLCQLASLNDSMSARISDKIKTLEKKYIPLPRLLPAHLLHSHAITLNNLFGKSCNISFTFHQDRELSILTKEFQERPSSYTLLTKEQYRELNEAYADNDMQARDALCYTITNATNKQLTEEGLIVKTSQGNHITYSELSVHTLGYTSKSYEHGAKSNPDAITRLYMEHELNGENPAHFAARRQATDNKRHFTYSLKK